MTDFQQNNPMTNEPIEPPMPPQEVSPDSAVAAPEEHAADGGTQNAPDRVLYRWNFTEYSARNAKPPRQRRLVVYSVILSVVFLISFAMLVAVLWVGRYDPESSIRPGISGSHDDVAIDGVEQAKHTVAVIEVVKPGGGGTGSGIILRRDGYIATNHHVIEDATSIRVTFYDGTSAEAHVIGSSEIDDLAVIKVSRGDLPEARFAAYADCYVGQTVYAIGTPASSEYGWTTTKGIISYKDREVKIYDDDDRTLLKKLRLVQTDANVNPGNSGGPLINTDGEVVGVVSMKLAEGFEGIGFAIPADGAVDILNAIIEGKDFDSSVSHKRPMLGITCIEVEAGKYYVQDGNRLIELTEDQLDSLAGVEIIHPDATGVLVMGVSEGMDAEGKLRIGDIIVAVDSHAVVTGDDLSNYVNDLYVGDTVTLTVHRDGRKVKIKLTLTAQA